MKKIIQGVAIGAVVLSLSACGGVEKDAHYESVDSFKEAVQASGGECPGDTHKGQDGDDEQLLRCSDSLTLRLFNNEDETKKGRLGFAIGFMGEASILSGPNWIVQGPTEELTQIQDSLGGELSIK